MKLDIAVKQPGQTLAANEVNQIVTAINEIDVATKTPSHAFSETYFVEEGTTSVGGVAVPIITLDTENIGGGGGEVVSPETRDTLLEKLQVLPLSSLPDAILNNTQFETLGDGTIGISVAWLQSVVGSGNGNTTPAAPSNGIVDDTANTWTVTPPSPFVGTDMETSIDNGTTYVANTSNVFNVGDINAPTGYVKTRVKSASGRNPGATISNTSAFNSTASTTTPLPPSAPVTNDTANTFSWTNTAGYTAVTDYEYTLDGGVNVLAVSAKPIFVGNVAKAIGQVGVRVKPATGRNASDWLYNAVAFTVSLTTPGTPTNGVVNDTANTFTVTPPSGYTGTDLETSLDSGVTWTPNSSTSFNVGNVAYAIGAVRTRVSASTGRNAGAAISNATAFTAAVDSGSLTNITAPSEAGNMSFDGNTLTVTNIPDVVTRSRFSEHIPEGQVGRVIAILNGVQLVLDSNGTGFNNNPAYAIAKNLTSNKVEAVINNNDYHTIVGYVEGTTYGMIELKATTVEFSYSTDGVSFLGTQSYPRAAGDNWVKAYGGTTGNTLGDIKGSGLIV